jgi:hypothetical protein
MLISESLFFPALFLVFQLVLVIKRWFFFTWTDYCFTCVIISTSWKIWKSTQMSVATIFFNIRPNEWSRNNCFFYSAQMSEPATIVFLIRPNEWNNNCFKNPPKWKKHFFNPPKMKETILIKISPNVMEQAEILHTWKILGSQSINQSINQSII